MALSFKQEATYDAKKNLWTWQLWIVGPDAELKEIDHIIYSLHPSFPNPVRTAKRRDTEFELRGESWGKFPVKAWIVYKNGAAQHHQFDLLLNDPGSGRVAPLLHVPAAPGGPKEKYDLARRFKRELKAFDYARNLLREACDELRALPETDRNEESRLLETKVVQELALCTYKDATLPLDARLNRALKILDKAGPGLQQHKHPETLGLIGAIYKRKWEVDRQRLHLERALHYYTKGYQEMLKLGISDASYDGGAWTGVNACYVHDLLANEIMGGGQSGAAESREARQHRDNARTRRKELVTNLEALRKVSGREKWWLLVSLVEAYVGLCDAASARACLDDAVKRFPRVDDWEKESTTTQLASVIRLQASWLPKEHPLNDPRKWGVLEMLLPGKPEVMRQAWRGKVGLALSGGGFRASLFHIGVLARLAELDLLRQVEVLSCVSGGSIIGAHYYLEVRRLLQTKLDKEITRDDYIEIVRKIEKEFLEGVQRNIRTRVISNGFANARMILFPNKYSRTERTGNLYEQEIFNRVKDGEEAKDRYLNDLFIQPLIEKGSLRVPDEEFSPRQHNWRRVAKAPVLILNATSLNTGHAWQFTAAWMGEPPPRLESPIDVNDRLERNYYSELPQKYHRFRLGQAVAASSCVPGLFDPLVLHDLYPDQTVRLVDGGVQDNQGVAGLLDQDCTVLLVSDASGQMYVDPNPSQGTVGVVLRADGILQARVRDAQYHELAARQRAGLLKDLMFVHLRQDLDAQVVRPIGLESDQAPQAPPLTRYGIPPQVQRLIATLRTDLDSFSDTEAYALMLSGYRMTEWQLRNAMSSPIANLDPQAEPVQAADADHRADWLFLAVEDQIRQTSPDIVQQLTVGRERLFKIWRLSTPLMAVSWLGLVVILIALAGLAWTMWQETPVGTPTVGSMATWLVLLVGPMILGYFLNRWILHIVFYRDTLARIGLGVVLSTIGWAVAGIHLRLFDRLFLGQGKIPAVPRPARPLSNEGKGELLP